MITGFQPSQQRSRGFWRTFLLLSPSLNCPHVSCLGVLAFSDVMSVMWGNPYLKLLRRQLEQYIAEELGEDRLSSGKNQTELRKIKREMASLKKRLNELQARRTELENQIKKGKSE